MNNPTVINIPIGSIRILNPRTRDQVKFKTICESIKKLGLKKPIKVSKRIVKDGEEPGYDLICGQGRIEAFLALEQLEIPAIVVEVPKAERLLMSLVENMARRNPRWSDLIDEIGRLTKAGHSNRAIAKKLGIHPGNVGGILKLKQMGEERILDAAIKGKIPIELAIEIAGAGTHEAQLELLKAYEEKKLTPAAILSVQRVINQRKYLAGPSARAVSLTLPLRQKPFESPHLFPFFSGLLAEGSLKEMQCRLLKIDPADEYTRLLKTAGGDVIGAVTVEESQE